MSEINDLLGHNGAGQDCCGLTFFRPNFTEKAEYEKWLKRGARQEVIEWEEFLDDDEYSKQVAARGAVISAHTYSWNVVKESMCGQSLQSSAGRIRLLYIVAKHKQPAVKVEEIATLYEDNRADFDDLIDNYMLRAPPKFEIPGTNAGEWDGSGAEDGGGCLSFSQAVAKLLGRGEGDPHGGHTLAEIAMMDEYQLINAYLRPGDPEAAENGYYLPLPCIGQVVPDQRFTKCGTFQEMFWQVWRDRGCNEDEIEVRAEEYQKRNPGAFGDWKSTLDQIGSIGKGR